MNIVCLIHSMLTHEFRTDAHSSASASAAKVDIWPDTWEGSKRPDTSLTRIVAELEPALQHLDVGR